ncbi:MAG: NfeD family protein [Cyanobacteria bacterium J06632_22]
MMMRFPKTIVFFEHQGLGTAVKAIAADQPGRVRFQATDWPAKLYRPTPMIDCDRKVRVVGREGLTLLVVPAEG